MQIPIDILRNIELIESGTIELVNDLPVPPGPIKYQLNGKELEKFIRENNSTEIEIELKDMKNLLHDVVIEDIITFKTTKTKEGYKTYKNNDEN